MKCSRREVCFWIPALMASRGLAAEAPIPSKVVRFEDMPVESGGGNALRRILEGDELRESWLESHASYLPDTIRASRPYLNGPIPSYGLWFGKRRSNSFLPRGPRSFSQGAEGAGRRKWGLASHFRGGSELVQEMGACPLLPYASSEPPAAG